MLVWLTCVRVCVLALVRARCDCVRATNHERMTFVLVYCSRPVCAGVLAERAAAHIRFCLLWRTCVLAATVRRLRCSQPYVRAWIWMPVFVTATLKFYKNCFYFIEFVCIWILSMCSRVHPSISLAINPGESSRKPKICASHITGNTSLQFWFGYRIPFLHMHPPVCLLVDLSTRKRPVVVFAHSTRLSWSRRSRGRFYLLWKPWMKSVEFEFFWIRKRCQNQGKPSIFVPKPQVEVGQNDRWYGSLSL